MHRNLLRFHGLIGLLILTLPGCHSYGPYGYNPYNQYGYGQQPGYQTSPVGGMPAPAGAYLNPNDFSATQAAAPQPPNYVIQPQQWRGSDNPVGTQPQPATGGNAGGGDAFEPPMDRWVPDYRDPAAGDSSSSDRGGDESSPPFGRSSSTGVQRRGVQSVALSDTPQPLGTPGPVFLGEPTTTAASTERDAGEEAFYSPVPLMPVSSNRPIAQTPREAAVKRPNPYAYDREGHRWLRGVVDFDEKDESWHMIYNLTPDSKDEYGGDITLIDDTRLDFVQNDDVVLVEGRIDSSVRDGFGKPCYRIKKIDRLVPKTTN